jgi:hypothetical protein
MVRKKDSGKAAVPKAPTKPDPWDDWLGVLLQQYPELTADDVRGLTMDQVRQLLMLRRAQQQPPQQAEAPPAETQPLQQAEAPPAVTLARQLRRTGLSWKEIADRVDAQLGIRRSWQTVKRWVEDTK